MPIYEYTCRKCGYLFEQLVMKGDTPGCPDCKSQDLEQMISLPAISSENIRQHNLKGARAKAKAAKFEQDHEHHKRLHAEHD